MLNPAFTKPSAYKARIAKFYDRLSPHFRDLWGPHLHDGYYARGATSKEMAQDHLVDYLAELSEIRPQAEVLDIGCGMGATSVALAKRWNCRTRGVTLSDVQVGIARELAAREGVADRARFDVADADNLQVDAPADVIWMVGVLAHLPDQAAFVSRSVDFLKPGGRFVLGDWMAGPNLTSEADRRRVEKVLDGMLMPSIFSRPETERRFAEAGYRIVASEDITAETAATWEEGVSIIQARKVANLAFSVGTDAVRLLMAIHGMKKAMADGLISYGVIVAER